MCITDAEYILIWLDLGWMRSDKIQFIFKKGSAVTIWTKTKEIRMQLRTEIQLRKEPRCRRKRRKRS